ncbi:dienelactone hydrolase family protein [Paenibacillus sp. HB172176]|uniref:carboxylesterase family protein n=1 Tax=Paenibacillus sp. HB172176 TaxID=2493690 RepID=UPI001F0F8BE8
MILFLHGVKKRGDDIRLLDHYGIMKHAAANPAFPFIAVAPQCPLTKSWTDMKTEIIQLCNEMNTRFGVDQKRIYLVGFSMGGNGVWELAFSEPELFAAAVPIAGWYESRAAKHISIPVWAFHGEEDDVIPMEQSIQMVNAMKKAGREVQFTTYPGMKHEHEVMDRTFANPALYEWLLSKRN